MYIVYQFKKKKVSSDSLTYVLLTKLSTLRKLVNKLPTVNSIGTSLTISQWFRAFAEGVLLHPRPKVSDPQPLNYYAVIVQTAAKKNLLPANHRAVFPNSNRKQKFVLYFFCDSKYDRSLKQTLFVERQGMRFGNWNFSNEYRFLVAVYLFT